MSSDVDRAVDAINDMTRQLLAKRAEQDAVLTRIQERQNRIIDRMWIICATWLVAGFVLGACSILAGLSWGWTP